ncbi:hypothetical protein [Actinomadura rubrisoli]|uniref:Uncharacterized protein n=1 Tax=Actinomadura rubrisoli TaxID=2530368 RepID=A0A4R4ZRC3_9ACTN|nr:hypothetical protein [Actinomadura rubrisoli]TDD60624.1 hypothetical protein E1298_45920 [Actinomadura rubrisoli]
MSRKSRKSPQEKKRLSYLKDRRNFYGENDKSSRKNIPRNRKLKHRAARHRANQAVYTAGQAPDGLEEDAFTRRLSGRRPASLWRKQADAPLSEVVEYRLRRRVARGNAGPGQAEERIRRIRRRLG